MAELPRYKRDRLLGAVSPQYQGVALQEASRASQTLSTAMDRLSRAAFGVAGEQAKIEGMEYGAANAPTIQQLAEAKAQGKDVTELLPGDKLTVFGTAARGVAIDMISATLETEARESLTAAQTMYTLGKMDLPTLQTKIATIEDSYSSIIEDISPASAAKFRASIGLAGNSVFLSAAKDKVKKDKDALEAQLAGGVQGMIDSVTTIFDAGATVAPDGSIITPYDSIEVLRTEIQKYGSMVENGETFVRENLRLLDKKVEDVVVSSVTNWVLQDPINRERQVRTGEYTDQNIAITINSMSPELRAAARKAANDALSRDLSRESALSSRRDRIRGDAFAALIPQLSEAKRAGNDDLVEQLLGQMEELDPVKADAQREAIFTSGGVDGADTITGLDTLSQLGQLTPDIVAEARINRQISESTYRRYLGEIDARRDQDHNDAMTIAENSLRPGVRSLINPGDDDRKALKALGELENAMILEKRANPGFDRIKFAQDWMQARSSSGPSEADINTAKNKLKGLAQSFGMAATASPEEVKAELDRRVSNNQYNANGAAAYAQYFRTLGVE